MPSKNSISGCAGGPARLTRTPSFSFRRHGRDCRPMLGPPAQTRRWQTELWILTGWQYYYIQKSILTMGRKPGGSIMLRIHCLPHRWVAKGKWRGKKGDVPTSLSRRWSTYWKQWRRKTFRFFSVFRRSIVLCIKSIHVYSIFHVICIPHSSPSLRSLPFISSYTFPSIPFHTLPFIATKLSPLFLFIPFGSYPP